jgi:hypothetical protein
VQLLLKNPQRKAEFCIDIYWKKLQQQHVWLLLMPLTVTQYEDYSDIEKRVVNYHHIMLDFEKKYLQQYLFK